MSGLRVLVIGGGGREHALAWKLAQSPRLGALYAAPGNPGIGRVAECIPVRLDDVTAVADLAERERIDLTVVGPEGPLAQGLADVLEARGRPVFGPSRAAAALESSKAFAKTLFARQRIPTARFGIFEDPAAARAFVKELGGRVVVKADGLAAGKGAVVCADAAEADRGHRRHDRAPDLRGFRSARGGRGIPRGRGGLGLCADRRADGLSHGVGPGPQGRSRRRPWAEHRRDGGVLAAPRARPRRSKSRSSRP